VVALGFGDLGDCLWALVASAFVAFLVYVTISFLFRYDSFAEVLARIISFLLSFELCGNTFLSRSDYVLDYFHSHFVLFYQLGYSVEGECWMLCTPEVLALVYTSVPRHSLFSWKSAAIIFNSKYGGIAQW
jgi:hypothetical protein